MFNIDVIYALPEKQYVINIDVAKGTTVEQAIVLSGILTTCTDINLAINQVGIFSKIVKRSDLVNQHDRIEIYRPMIADPKELRRQRAKKTNK